MRLWTLHPRYLDSRGLVALWREALLAQTVLARDRGGYSRHPQLERFRDQPKPRVAIAAYLHGVAEEATLRAYNFDTSKILSDAAAESIDATSGQLAFEWTHLMAKLRVRSPDVYDLHSPVSVIAVHPLFRLVDGPIASWERAAETERWLLLIGASGRRDHPGRRVPRAVPVVRSLWSPWRCRLWWAFLCGSATL
jgi:hypothetical protein